MTQSADCPVGPTLELTERVNKPGRTFEDALAYVEEQRPQAAHYGVNASMPIDSFLAGGADLENFDKLMEWWPRTPAKDGTEPPPAPLLTNVLDAIYAMGQPRTFQQELTLHWQRAVQWADLNGVDPQYPNETKEERKARLNRERVALSRKRKADPEAVAKAERTKALWAEYLALCQERRDVEAGYKQRIADKKAEYQAAKAEETSA